MISYQSTLHEVVENATNIAPATKNKYLRDLNAWVKFAGKDPRNWTRKRAQNFYADLLRTLKSQSANRIMASLRFAVKWWAIQEDDPTLNFAIVQLAKNGLPEPKYALIRPQVIGLLDSCENLETDPVDARDFALMVTALETGMRSMSLRSMVFEHCFFGGEAHAGYPTVRVHLKGSGRDRVAIPISDTAISAYDHWLAWLGQPRGPVFRAIAEDASQGHRPGPNAVSSAGLHKIIAGRGELIKLSLSPHVFRHTFVTWRLDAGFMPHEVSAVTHHTVPGMGAMGGYVDEVLVGAKMRASTPEWLAEYVATRVGR